MTVSIPRPPPPRYRDPPYQFPRPRGAPLQIPRPNPSN